ncbi:hypothetical protein Esti_004411 [Eimeria stiedai]
MGSGNLEVCGLLALLQRDLRWCALCLLLVCACMHRGQAHTYRASLTEPLVGPEASMRVFVERAGGRGKQQQQLLLLLLLNVLTAPVAAAFSVPSSCHRVTCHLGSLSLPRMRLRHAAVAAAAAGAAAGSSSLAAAADANLLGPAGDGCAGGGAVSSAALQRVEELVKKHNLFIFMKGTPSQPQCGFSRVACGIESIPHLDVLSDPEVREAAKVFSQWDTFPQLYVHQEFVGGADVVLQMFKDKSLSNLLQQHGLI